jgi:hypothetical protein
MFLREATLTPFKQAPNYPRFMELSMNIFRFVGLGRAMVHMADRTTQVVCGNAVKVRAKNILMQCFHQPLLVKKKEIMKQTIREYVE